MVPGKVVASGAHRSRRSMAVGGVETVQRGSSIAAALRLPSVAAVTS
jgi:hypothetical protein